MYGRAWKQIHLFAGKREECTPKSSWWPKTRPYARTGDNEIKGVTLNLRRLRVICSWRPTDYNGSSRLTESRSCSLIICTINYQYSGVAFNVCYTRKKWAENKLFRVFERYVIFYITLLQSSFLIQTMP